MLVGSFKCYDAFKLEHSCSRFSWPLNHRPLNATLMKTLNEFFFVSEAVI